MISDTNEARNDHATKMLIDRLERSHDALIGALSERTESDFRKPIDLAVEKQSLPDQDYQYTLGHALASLAQDERLDLASVRSEPIDNRELPEKLIPPQITHDLAGARHQTLKLLAEIEGRDTAEALVESIIEREMALVTVITETLDSQTN